MRLAKEKSMRQNEEETLRESRLRKEAIPKYSYSRLVWSVLLHVYHIVDRFNAVGRLKRGLVPALTTL